MGAEEEMCCDGKLHEAVFISHNLLHVGMERNVS